MTQSKEINTYMNRLGSEAKEASLILAQASLEQKNEALSCISEQIESDRDEILSINKKDLDLAKQKSIGSALIDRLELNDSRINSMISGLQVVSELPDPVGEITDLDPTPSGIEVSKMRVPLGVVGIIYESRPNVTADAAALCLKSGNACLLRGGSEAILSNKIIWNCLQEGLKKARLPKECIQLVETTDRQAVKTLLHLDDYLDVVIPRGGKGLVQLISDESKVPVIKHLDGICHVYIDEAADIKKAENIAFNAKTYRYGICGAMETLLVHSSVASLLLPSLEDRFSSEGVEVRGCQKTLQFIDAIEAKAYGQKECFEAGVNFARTEGIVPAPEATHAVKGAINAALECKKNGKSKTILFNLCGHGHFDMKAYGDYFDNKLAEDKYDEAGVNKALEELPKIA